ncbi:DUF2809 domain-containing protein [Microbacterium sp. PMB16]|uniref:ribosomal maturation YjgA family protein n=1 Tax=Microbacterium sp. PMB16 TaxID=3120157 RepID=UPI003F4BC321
MTNDAPAPLTRRRVTLAVLAAGTVGIGLLVHRGVGGTVGDIAGDALYAVLIYLLAALVAPRAHRAAAALIAFAVCAGVELLQLTALPRAWADVFPPIELVLGSGFDARDLGVYALAVAAASLIDVAVTRLSADAASGNATGRPPEGERPV